MTKVLNPLRCSSKLLNEQLSYKPIYTRLSTKLLKCFRCLEHLEQLRQKVLKVLTITVKVSTLAETRMNTGIRLSCSMSNLGERVSSNGVGGFKSPSLVGPRPAGQASAHGEVSQRGGGVKRVSPGCMIASENPIFAAAGHGLPTRINVDTLVAMNSPHGRKAAFQGLPERGADHHEG